MPPPSYVDGLTALGQLTARCINTGVDYICFDGDPSAQAVSKEFTNQSGEALGSDNRVGFTKGTLNLQLKLATDALPQPTYIFLFRGVYYIAGTVGPKFVSNGEVKFSVAVTAAVNPVITTLLSVDGQLRKASATTAAPYSLDCDAVNLAAGSQTWAAAGLPPGHTINVTTGVISGTATLAGTYNASVTVTDGDGKAGVGFLTLTVT